MTIAPGMFPKDPTFFWLGGHSIFPLAICPIPYAAPVQEVCFPMDRKEGSLRVRDRDGFSRDRNCASGHFLGGPEDDDGIELVGTDLWQCLPHRRFTRNSTGSLPLPRSPVGLVEGTVSPESSH